MKQLTMLLIIIALSACAAPLGTISVHSIDEENKLSSALMSTAEMLTTQDTIYKTERDGSTDGEDVFAIYFTDTYLRYLKDIGGINEVLIVVQFTEAVTGTESDTITKILGPFNNIGDATKAPLLNKALYGPKKMESDLLSMNIKIYEYDLEENDNNAAMLNFIASSASALAIADPVTLGEIKVVKEIAQTLVGTNENDLVLEIDMDFVAGNTKYKPYSTAHILPLRDSEIVLVKQEACRVGTCYDYFSQHSLPGKSNYPGYLTDTIMAIPTTIVRATIDVPDNRALQEFKAENIKIKDSGLYHNDNQDLLFKDKTWLRLSIVKGGDSTLWEKRKALYPQEEEINRLLRNPNSLTLANMTQFSTRLETLQKSLQAELAEIKLTSTTSHNNVHYVRATSPASDNKTSQLCLKYSNPIKLIDTQIRGLANISDKAKEISRSKDSVCYEIEHNTGFTAAKGFAQVTYSLSNTNKATFLPILITPAIVQNDFTAITCKQTETSNYTINVTSLADKSNQVKSITAAGTETGFRVQGNDIELNTSIKNAQIRIFGVLGGEVTLNAASCASS